MDCEKCNGKGYEEIGPLQLDCDACNGTGMVEDDDPQEEEEEDAPENYPTVSVDGTEMGYEILSDAGCDPDDIERVQVSFPDAENGYQTEAQAAKPLGWCNNAAITLDRKEDSVTLTISVGDPRGAFALTVRRLSDGRLVMHVPHAEETYLHMPLKPLHPGTYEVGN